MSNDFEMALMKSNKVVENVAVQTTIGRYTQEVQGMVFMAKQYPRNQVAAWQRIKDACQRKTLAEVASYSYPRGGEKVTGPSIRLAEVLAQNWGNMTFGVIELEQRNGESTAQAFSWDLETNVRSEKIFTVKHEIGKKNGVIKKLTDPRDIYELVANMGARRQRACILAILPKDLVEAAMEECENTLTDDKDDKPNDRIKKMIEKFSEHGVTQEMIEKKQGYKIAKFTAKDVSGLVGIYNSIKDGMGKKEDYFEDTPAPENDIDTEFKKYQEGKADAEADN